MRDFSVIAIFERKFFYMSEEIEIKDEVLDLKVTETYDENQIQVLEGLEAVRKRPGMYIGSTSARGLHHLVYEIVDNSIDEALAGYCTHIEVTIEKGDIIRVTDNGRGIPCGIHPQMGIPTLEVVLTVLHAGGKFDGSGYKVSGGLHGVGSSVVNALSDWLEAEVRDGHTKHYMRFERGMTTVKMRDTPCESETGTTIRFHADPEIFETTVYEYDVLEKRLREQAFLNAGLKITLRDERDDEPVEEVMHYEGGIRQFVEHLNRTKTPLHEQVIYMEGSRDTSMAEVAMQYTDSYSELMLSFANNINTTEGGTHETGFKAALTRVLNDYGKKYKLLKDDESFKGEDAREGLTAIISVKLQEAQFERPDQDQAWKQRYACAGRRDGLRKADDLLRGKSAGGPHYYREGADRRARPRGCEEGARNDAPQVCARFRFPAGQARRLHRKGPDLH